jgi:predicted acylesterase/phospholipase RssA
MNHKRIPVTLNFSGGISLGAYMAGIFYELTQEALKGDESTLVIDMITGGSAGAVTGALAAYYLLGAEKLPEAEKSLFYQAWVERVDAKMLSAAGQGPDIETIPVNSDPEQAIASIIRENWSLLSGQAIRNIADNLVGDLKEKLLTEGKGITAPLALIFTVTNLQGFLEKTDLPLESQAIDGELTDLPGEKEAIETITSSETRQFLFYPGLPIDENLEAMWQKLVLSARASAAFPAAFPPISDVSTIDSPNLIHLSEDYFQTERADSLDKVLDRKRLGPIYVDPTHLIFQYTDGGVLDGLPIVEGIKLEKALLVDKVEPNDLQKLDRRFPQFQQQWRKQWETLYGDLGVASQQRLYVYIQPDPANSIESRPRLTKGTFSILQVAMSGLTLPKSEHDAIRLKNIQERNRDALRRQHLIETISKLDSLSYEQKETLFEAINDAIPYQYVQLRRIDPSLLANLYHNERPGVWNALANALTTAIAEKPYMLGALQNRTVKSLLASDFLGAFGGFFNRAYREHDFLLGRICAQLWLLENCWGEVTSDDPRVIALIKLIQSGQEKFLTTDPKATDLLESKQAYLVEDLAWRALRILIKETTANNQANSAQTRGISGIWRWIQSFWQMFVVPSGDFDNVSPEAADQILIRWVLGRMVRKVLSRILLVVGLAIVAIALIGILLT